MRHIIFINGLYINETPGKPNMLSNMTRSVGAYQLKHWLSKFGIKGQVIDFCQWMTVKEMMTLIEHFKGPETVAVGFTTSFWPFGRAPGPIAELIATLRQKHPTLKMVGGGMNPHNFKELFDKRCWSYAEDDLVQYIQELLGKKGLSLFNKKFDITQLDHRFDHTDAILSHEVLPIELGRGCIFKCKFCAHPNLGKSKLTYQRRFDLLTDELRWNYEQFGVTKVNFVDDTINEDLEKVKNLATLPKTLGFDLRWNGFLRADLVWSQDNAPELLLESGLRSAFFGIETFNKTAGSAVGKGWAGKHGKDYLPHLHHDLWKGRVRSHLNFIAGLPGETLEETMATGQWVKEQQVFGSRFVALYINGTNTDKAFTSEFERSAEKYGYEMRGQSWKTDLMTREDALVAVGQIMDDLEPVLPIASWNLFGLYSIGMPIEQADSLTRTALEKIPPMRALQFKRDYVKRLLALKE